MEPIVNSTRKVPKDPLDRAQVRLPEIMHVKIDLLDMIHNVRLGECDPPLSAASPTPCGGAPTADTLAMLLLFVMSVSLGVTLAYPFPLPYPALLAPSTSSTVTSGHPSFPTSPVCDTISSFWMASLTTCGLFPFAVSLTPSPTFLISLRG